MVNDDGRAGAKALDAGLEHSIAGGAAATVAALAPDLGATAATAIVAGVAVAAAAKAALTLSRAAGEAAQKRAAEIENAVLLELAASAAGLEEALADPRMKQAVFHGYRAAMDALDPSVVPILARLVVWYRAEPLDPFFRGASRVLRDLTAGDLEELRVMLAFAGTAGSGPAIRVEHNGAAQACIAHSHLVKEGETHVDGVRQLAPELAPRDAWVRLFDLLERHGLARRAETLSSAMGRLDVDPNASIALILRRDMVERLANLVGPPASPLTEAA